MPRPSPHLARALLAGVGVAVLPSCTVLAGVGIGWWAKDGRSPSWDTWRGESAWERWDSGGNDCADYWEPPIIGVDDSLCDWPSAWDPSSAIQTGCDSVALWFDVYTIGWTGGGELVLVTTSEAYSESHPMLSYDFSANGWWDNLYLQLEVVSSVGQVTDGVSTLFQCGSSNTNVHLVVYDMSEAEADCAVWGADPDAMGLDCANWN